MAKQTMAAYLYIDTLKIQRRDEDDECLAFRHTVVHAATDDDAYTAGMRRLRTPRHVTVLDGNNYVIKLDGRRVARQPRLS